MWGRNTLRGFPDIAVEIAVITSTYAHLEGRLLSLYAVAMGLYFPMPAEDDDGEQYAPPDHPIAYQVFEALQTLKPRLDLIQALLKTNADPAEYEFFRDALSPRVRKVAKRRNKVVHASWAKGLAHNGPNDLRPVTDAVIYRPPSGGPMLAYKLQDFQEITEAIARAASEVLLFQHRVRKGMVKKA